MKNVNKTNGIFVFKSDNSLDGKERKGVFVQHWCEHQEDYGKMNKDEGKHRSNQCSSQVSWGFVLIAYWMFLLILQGSTFDHHFTRVTAEDKESNSYAADVCLKPGNGQKGVYR